MKRAAVSTALVFLCVAGPALPAGGATEENVAAALGEALQDEIRARETYRAVIEKHGPVRPFAHIVNAEQKHIEALQAQFRRLKIDLPPATPVAIAAAPTVRDACRAAVEAERANAALYDDLIERAAADKIVVGLFRRLQRASLERHLPAFQRCVERRGSAKRQQRQRCALETPARSVRSDRNGARC
jgi:hypothetical protein